MSRTVIASLGLAALALASLSAPVAAYEVTVTDVAGVLPAVTASAPVGADKVSCTLDVGTWTATVVCKDAAGNVVTNADGTPLVIPPSAPYEVVDAPQTVMVPISIELAAA